MDRGKLFFDESLCFWYAQWQDEEVAVQHRASQSPEEQEEREGWRRIQAAAAQRVFGARQREE